MIRRYIDAIDMVRATTRSSVSKRIVSHNLLSLDEFSYFLLLADQMGSE